MFIQIKKTKTETLVTILMFHCALPKSNQANNQLIIWHFQTFWSMYLDKIILIFIADIELNFENEVGN